jgi:putative transposase
VVWSFVYLVLRRSLELILLCFRSAEAKEIEILVFLIRDRDSKFTRAFDDVWRSTGAEIIRTPVQAPNANAVAERWVGTVRRECLDHLLIVGRQQLVRVLRRYVEHYNQRRPQRSLAHATPVPSERAEARSAPNLGRLRRCDVLGGLIHEYEYAA